jgi:CRISPR type I-E-associated protein CasB/Cse2
MLTKLARLVKLVKQKSGGTIIDFSGLLDDLIRWNFDTQPVQRKWARMIFTNETMIEEKE